MAGKKTGLYLSPIAEEIVNEVAQKYGYTKVSNTVNFIILEYQKLSQKPKDVKEEKVEEEQQPKKTNYDGWFVVEDKPS